MNINITDLCVNTAEKQVLNKFNLNIKEGEIHVIMGPNGVGKSTLSNVIMGNPSYSVTSGDILVDGKSILKLSVDERSKMGIFLSFQNPTFVEGVTTSEFIKNAINERREKPIGLYDYITELEKNSKEVSLSSDMLHRSLNENFSGGEKKKNEILQMKMLKPKFIILDELDSGLDVDSLKIVCDNVNNYLKENKDVSVLMITHYYRILEYIKPKFVHVMKDGHIVKSGNISLAKKVDKDGYSSASLVSGDKKSE